MAFFPAQAATRYIPRQGDYFSYHEVIDLGQGTGDYAGYTEHTVVDGTETMNTVFANATVAAHYNFAWTWSNSTGSTQSESSSGNFTYSSTSFLYVMGTDNLTGYVNPTVWFYIDNSTQNGRTFYLLDTKMTVTSTSYSYQLPSENRNVNAISAQGSSSYLRNDVYGRFNAEYTWTAYFDPSTGYIIGYDYVEHDISGFAGFTYTESLYVTSTSYPLATAPPSNWFSQYLGVLLVGIALLVLLVVIVFVLSRRTRRRALPAHSPVPQAAPTVQGQYYRPPPSQQGIDLTPMQQPPVQQIVIKEVVKVKCRYCGALSDSTLQVCPFCGAPRT